MIRALCTREEKISKNHLFINEMSQESVLIITKSLLTSEVISENYIDIGKVITM
jgi:hypothetical protein